MIFDQTLDDMRRPAPPPDSDALDALRDLSAWLAANPLISALASRGLGTRLNPPEIQTLLNFVAGLEHPRQPAERDGGPQAAA